MDRPERRQLRTGSDGAEVAAECWSASISHWICRRRVPRCCLPPAGWFLPTVVHVRLDESLSELAGPSDGRQQGDSRLVRQFESRHHQSVGRWLRNASGWYPAAGDRQRIRERFDAGHSSCRVCWRLTKANSISTGESTLASTVLRDANGNVLSNRDVSWSSDNPAVAAVSPQGLVTGVAPGTAHINATSEGKTGAATITVTAIPVASVSVIVTPNNITLAETSQASATTLDAGGNPLTGREVSWSSSNEAVATADAAGHVTPHAVGSASITATSEGKSGSATVTVTPGPGSTVVVTPSST